MKYTVERVYDYRPAETGTALLVDRLWPRGISKESLGSFEWVKELTPGDELREWFHADKAKRYEDFAERFATELKDRRVDVNAILKNYDEPLHLLTAAKEIERSHIPTLTAFITEL